MTTKAEIEDLVRHSTWITSELSGERINGKSPLTIFAFDFETTSKVISARLITTGLGVYKAFINNSDVADEELLPGYTEYDRHLMVSSFDVALLIDEGKNTLHFEVSDGWYKGAVGMMRATEQWGEQTAIRGVLQLEFADGTSTVLGTDSKWRSRLSSHAADMIYGEFVDFTSDVPGHCEPVGGAATWAGVAELPEYGKSLVQPLSPPVRVTQSLAPVAVSKTALGWLVDFGQNTAGWVRLSNLGPDGSRLRIVYSEALDNNGEVTQQNFKPDVPFLDHPLEPGQIDEVVSAGIAGQVFEPKHSTKGFRYVRIEGLPTELHAHDIAAQVVHSDMDLLGSFECSNQDLNWLHDSTVWSFRGNAIDIPADCPTRERAGWGADWDIFFDAATFMYDVNGFTLKWLYDLAEMQWANGVVGNMAPMPRIEGEHGKLSFTNGSAGWGDSIISIPFKHYLEYGDKRVLESMWPRMIRWIEFVQGKAKNERHPSRIARSEVAAAHEEFLWDTGFHFGEWFVPGEEIDFPSLMSADKGVIATAFYRKSTHELSIIAEVLGNHTEAANFAELSENIRKSWQKEFLSDAGEIIGGKQADCVRALSYKLVEESQESAVIDQLVKLIHEAGDHLATGFLATPLLLPTLANHGQADLAFKILLKRDWPSWLSMKDQGATTIWERWEGYDAEGNPAESHNHYSKGAVISFLQQYLAGIKRAPLGAQFDWQIQPFVGGGVTWAKASHQTLAGPISSSWSIEHGEFELEVNVPEGATAKVVMPNGEVHLVEGTTRTLRSNFG